MFWQKFVLLCNQKGKSPNRVCAELGYSANTATKWKQGAVPRDTTLKKIADYFEITASELLDETPGETQKEPPKQDDSIESAMSALSDLMGELTDEDVGELRKYAEFLISKNKNV